MFFPLFIPPFYPFTYDIVKSPTCQYPKTSITTTAAGLPSVTNPGAKTTALLPYRNSKSALPSRQPLKERLPEYEPGNE
jgi:hypothetical protein